MRGGPERMQSRGGRRRLVQGLVVVALGVTLVSCTEADPGVLESETFLGAKNERLNCPFPEVTGSPQLAGVTAYGLDSLRMWRPGFANKVNWVSDEPDGPMELSLRPDGEEGPVYRLKLPTSGPSMPALPGPGCWELTAKSGERTEKVGLVVQQDRILGLGGLPEEPNGRAAALWSDPKEMRQLLQALGKAKEEEVDSNRPWFPVSVVWEVTPASLLRVYPAHEGKPALLQVDAGLVTGDCERSAQWLTATLPRDLAETLQENVELRTPAWEMPESTAECHPFVPKA